MDEFDWCASPPSPFSDLTDFDAPWSPSEGGGGGGGGVVVYGADDDDEYQQTTTTRFGFAPAPIDDDDDQFDFDDFGLEFELDDEQDPSSLGHSFVSGQSLPNGYENAAIDGGNPLYAPSTNHGLYAAAARQGVPGQIVGQTYHHLNHHNIGGAAESSGLESPSPPMAPYFSLVISTPKKVHQRQAANMRERKRMKTINDAFECLRERIPVFGADKKLSKVDTLRLAVRYIQHLSDVLTSSDEMRSTGTMTSFEETESKVVIRCYATLDTNCTGPLFGHSLSWQRSNSRSHRGRMSAKLWIPSLETNDT